MAKPLRVLIAEDNEADAELLLRRLRRGGYEVAHRRVDTPEDLGDALDRQSWDVVLSDYTMPRFEAPEALKVFQARGLDIPFIIVSGAVGEETAVAAMKAGAADFVRKDNLSKLDAVIERALRDAAERRQRRRLEKALVEVSDSEQRRIGMDLHDTLGQDLTGVAFLAKLLAERLTARKAPEAAEAGEVARRVNLAIAQTRAIARGLCPPVFNEEGLVSAIQEFISDVHNVFGVNCQFNCEQPVSLPDSALATHLYQITREAVNNAVSHGKARNIEVRLAQTPDRLELSISDDGTGMPAKDAGRGLGLYAMNHRARMIGGTLSIESTRNGGTAVTCTLPLNK